MLDTPKTDGFTAMADAAVAFFSELEDNNNRDWFEQRKDHYRTAIRQPAELMASMIAEELGAMTGASHAAKVFQINRDVRFSKDKSPYNRHLHIFWGTGRDDNTSPGWFFGLAPGYATCACGIPMFEGDRLAQYRGFVDQHGDELAQVLADVGGTISDWGPQPLKRVPAPYAKDHPHGDLLRRKGLTVGRPLGEDFRNPSIGLVSVIKWQFEMLLPLYRLLSDMR